MPQLKDVGEIKYGRVLGELQMILEKKGRHNEELLCSDKKIVKN